MKGEMKNAYNYIVTCSLCYYSSLSCQVYPAYINYDHSGLRTEEGSLMADHTSIKRDKEVVASSTIVVYFFIWVIFVTTVHLKH